MTHFLLLFVAVTTSVEARLVAPSYQVRENATRFLRSYWPLFPALLSSVNEGDQEKRERIQRILGRKTYRLALVFNSYDGKVAWRAMTVPGKRYQEFSTAAMVMGRPTLRHAFTEIADAFDLRNVQVRTQEDEEGMWRAEYWPIPFWWEEYDTNGVRHIMCKTVPFLKLHPMIYAPFGFAWDTEGWQYEITKTHLSRIREAWRKVNELPPEVKD